MGEFFRSRKFRIILCVVALLIGIMLYSVTQSGYTLPTTGVIGTILMPVRRLSNAISGAMEDAMLQWAQAEENQAENESLKVRIAELENELLDYNQTKADLEELEKFMGVKTEHEDFVLSNPCNIIGYVENDPFHSFYIDRGADDGLHVYDPVVTSEGLVGILSEVAGTYSTVETLCSPNLSVGAASSGKMPIENGIVEGDATLTEDYRCRMIYLEKDSSLAAGDLIVTSNTVGIFPTGYLIGTVVFLEPAESGLSYSAVIEPAVDFANLTQVMVVTDFAGKEQRDDAEQSESASEQATE